MTLDDAIADLARARKRLEAGQGRIARKNARQAIKLALRAWLKEHNWAHTYGKAR